MGVPRIGTDSPDLRVVQAKPSDPFWSRSPHEHINPAPTPPPPGPLRRGPVRPPPRLRPAHARRLGRRPPRRRGRLREPGRGRHRRGAVPAHTGTLPRDGRRRGRAHPARSCHRPAVPGGRRGRAQGVVVAVRTLAGCCRAAGVERRRAGSVRVGAPGGRARGVPDRAGDGPIPATFAGTGKGHYLGWDLGRDPGWGLGACARPGHGRARLRRQSIRRRRVRRSRHRCDDRRRGRGHRRRPGHGAAGDHARYRHLGHAGQPLGHLARLFHGVPGRCRGRRTHRGRVDRRQRRAGGRRPRRKPHAAQPRPRPA